MALYRQIQTQFWQDEFILDLNAREKLVYVWLLTNPKVNQIGCYKIAMRVACIETGLSEKELNAMLDKFTKAGKIKFDRDTSEILLLNWYKHNKSTSPKVIQNMRVCIGYVIHNDFKKYCIDTLSIPYKCGKDFEIYGMDTLSQEKEKNDDEEDNNITKPKPKQRANAPDVDNKKVELFFSHFGNDFWSSDFVRDCDKEIMTESIRFVCSCLTDKEILSLNQARFEKLKSIWFQSKSAEHPNNYFRQCFENLAETSEWFALGNKKRRG